VGGPACEYRISQGLLKENAAAAPWILDPTAASACARRGPRRELGSRVHGGPTTQNEVVRDLARPSQISRPRTRAGEGRQRARRSAAAHGGEFAGTALDRAVGHRFVRERALHKAEQHAHKPRGSGEWRGHPRRPAPEGGGAAAPASSWRRQNAQNDGISSRGFCSQCAEEGGELKNEGKAPVRELGNGGGSGGVGSAEQRGEEEEKKGKGERLTGGAQSSASAGKRERRGG
jgi:hypothetical protein